MVKKIGGKDFLLPPFATYFATYLQPIATRIEPLNPLCRSRLRLHRLQDLLADVEADLYSERDHDCVANL